MEGKTIWDQLDEDLYRLKIPLPFPLRDVNSYLIRGENDYTLIDPGIRTEQAERAWADALNQLGIGWRDIGRIVLTHHHPDHIGLAGLFQERCGAPVYLSALGRKQVEYFWGSAREAPKALAELYAKHGVDKLIMESLGEHMDGFLSMVSPLPDTTPIEEGRPLALGKRTFTAIHTPGHAPGHHMFFHEDSGDLFCGDHVLPKITPNIGWQPRFDDDPLASFLDSLARAAKLPVRRALPGHRGIIEDFAGRCRELIEHHRERLATIKGMLGAPRTAFEICRELFGAGLSVHQIRFAFAETLAHLIYLRNTGEIEERLSGGVLRYRSC